jgi:hypothetical protein
MKPTPRQIAALNFCCEILPVEFTGNIENKNEVSLFLSEHLDDAKILYEELQAEYSAYAMELYD